MTAKIRTSLIALLLMFAPGLLTAQSADSPDWFPDRLAEILGLSEEQIEALQQLQEDFQAAAAPLREEKASAGEALAAELESDEPSAAVVGELFLQIQDLNGQIEQLKQEFMASFEALLTPEQLAQLERFRRRQRRDRLAGFFADGPDQRPGFPGFFPAGVLTRVLDLTEEQQAQLEELLEQLRATVQPLHEELRSLHEQLGLLLESDAPDAVEVGTLVIAIHQASQQIAQARQDFASAFEAILTAEQLEKLQEFLENPGRGPRGRPDRAGRGR